MRIDYAMFVLQILSEQYVSRLEMSDSHKRQVSEALNLAISALKTINDMNTQGE